MPLGAIGAQLTHAAGESARLSPTLPDDTHAVVLQVEDEAALLRAHEALESIGALHVVVREPDPPFCGAATAIGVCPQPRENLRSALRRYQLLK